MPGGGSCLRPQRAAWGRSRVSFSSEMAQGTPERALSPDGAPVEPSWDSRRSLALPGRCGGCSCRGGLSGDGRYPHYAEMGPLGHEAIEV